jgi:hypothetical protein
MGALLMNGCSYQKPAETETEVIPQEQETVSEPAEETEPAEEPAAATITEGTNTFKWETTTSSLEFEYPASYRDIAVQPLATKPKITSGISDLLGPNDSLSSIDDIYFTDEVFGIEMPLRAIFIEVASEDTVKKILSVILSQSQIFPSDVSFNYVLGDETNISLPNLEDPVTKIEVKKDDSMEGVAYLFRLAVEGQTSTYAVLFISNYSDQESFNELDDTVTSSVKIGTSEAMSQKFGT